LLNQQNGSQQIGAATSQQVGSAVPGTGIPNATLIAPVETNPSANPNTATLPQEGPQGTPLDGNNTPAAQPKKPGELQVQGHSDLTSIYARDIDIRVLLATLAKEYRLNIVPSQEVIGTVSVTLHDKPILQALDAVLRIHGYGWQKLDDIIYVTKPDSKAGHNPVLLGLHLQVFELNFISATEAQTVVTGLLSPAGRAFIQANSADKPLQSVERLIVEDSPDRLQRIAEYISSVDVPPRQVLIEAEILQVSLGEDERHGVNLKQLLQVGPGLVTVESKNMTAAATGSPSFAIGLDGTDLDGAIEFLKSRSNVRTLATPKLLVINGKEGKIQVGSKLGYSTFQQNQTSTIQNVQFLELGVILTVTPIISRDGQVLMKVAPNVSGGRINPDTSLPEEDTTSTTTTVLLPDGRGMIIGGLIKEDDVKKSSWIPYLGEIPLLGKLFRRDTTTSSRSEVIIALTPFIVPYPEPILSRESVQYTNLTGLQSAVAPIVPGAINESINYPSMQPSEVIYPVDTSGMQPIIVAPPPSNQFPPSQSLPEVNLPNR
jgi:type II secretory pathway component GspD/PulD (secretin)